MNEVDAFACEHDGDVGIGACCCIGVAGAFSVIPCERVFAPMPRLGKAIANGPSGIFLRPIVATSNVEDSGAEGFVSARRNYPRLCSL